MSVALPFLFGVPPEYDHLRACVLAGGGIIHHSARQWLLGPVP